MAAEPNISRVATLDEQVILADEVFRGELYALADELRESHDAALAYAAECLDELAVHPEEKYLDRVAKLARFMYTRSYDPVLDVDTEELDRLKRLARDHPMVFLWSHKSHLDAFVFMKAMYDNEFRPQPLSFAGINMAFTGFGTLAKRSGAIFVRRTFKDDEIYKLVFKHYIDYLVRLRLPLSWSIEGTRSRTGKLNPPKMGLIQWVVDSYHREHCEDALLVPVSIAFDQIAEIDDFVAMQRGIPKRKESLSWFIGYISGMKARNGRIYLRFAEPVTLSESVPVPDSMFVGEASPERIEVRKLAFEVMSRIEHATPITITDLVTMVLLAANDRALTENQIRIHAQEIIGLINQRALPTAGDLSFDSGADLAATLAALAATSLIDCYSDGDEPVFYIRPGKQLAAAYYRNTIIHYFVSSAIAELAIATLVDGYASEEQFWETTLAYRDLLKFEFFFRTKSEYREDIALFMDERYPDWRSALGGSSSGGDAIFGRTSPLFGHSIMRSFIEAYWVLSRLLLGREGTPVAADDDKVLIGECLKVGREMLLRKRIATESALSEPLFATAVKLADYRGLLAGEPGELVGKRRRFADDVRGALDAVNRLQSYYDQQQEPTCDS